MERELIDLPLARMQHIAYENALRTLGVHVCALPIEDDMPDSVFVEDTVVVVDELAVMTYPTLPSRQCERRSVAEALAPHRRLEWITGEGRLEGGDVLRAEKTLYVGLSGRTNTEGIGQLREILAPFGYEVVSVPVRGCLHLKTGASVVGPRTLLANTSWIETDLFTGWNVLAVPGGDDFAANVLTIGNNVLVPAGFPQTESLLRQIGLDICAVDISELQKAEAGVTCCSILFESVSPR